jgi:PadR family transcriptional regulator, regulatory protein PadR
MKHSNTKQKRMDSNLLRGSLDLILLAILEDEPKYGLEIISEAKLRTDGYFEFKEGSLYPALHRLEKAKLLKAEFAPSDAGGPRRRYYKLTDKGIKELSVRREAFETFDGAVRAVWSK